MKVVRHFFLFLIASVLLIRCADKSKDGNEQRESNNADYSNPRNILINTYWAFDFDGAYERMTKKRQMMINKLAPFEKRNVRASYENSRVVFEKNGIMTSLLEGGMKTEDKWKLSADGKIMTVIHPTTNGQDTLINHIEILTPYNFVSRYEKNGKTMYVVLRKAPKKK